MDAAFFGFDRLSPLGLLEAACGRPSKGRFAMLRTLSVPFSVVMAALIFAPSVIAMPPDQCARWCSGRSDYYSCVADCLHG